MAFSPKNPPHTPPKALTLGIHMAWLMLGLSCVAGWANESETTDESAGKPVIARQPATQDGIHLPIQSTFEHKKSPTTVARKPAVAHQTHDSTTQTPKLPLNQATNTTAHSPLEQQEQPTNLMPAPTGTTQSPSTSSSALEDTVFVARQSTEFAPTQKSLNRLVDFYDNATPNISCQGNWHYPYATQHTDGLTASANYGYYNAKNFAELSGNVVINQDRHQIRANKLTLNPLTGQSHATGNVAFGSHKDGDDVSGDIKLSKLPKSDLMGLAERLEYNSKTGHAHAYDVAFASRSLHAHGYAKSLHHQDDTSYQLEDVIFSTCPPANRLWHIQADNITLDKETGRGTTTHTTLNIKNVPVFYLPYFNFPIDDRRTSGFLTPNLGLNSKDGLQLSTPYYLNLASHYDATLTPTIYTNRNPRLSAEFRYLTRQFGEGKIDGAYLPSDKQYNQKNRQHVFFDHTWQPFANKDLTVLATYRYVSDSSYLSDFDKLGIGNNPLNLPRRLKAEYKTDNITFNARAETFQKLLGTDHLGNPILDKDRPYTRLPQLSLQYRLPTTALQKQLDNSTINKHLSWLDSEQLSLSGVHDLAYFKKSIQDGSAIEKSGVRLYSQLSGSYPFMNTWGYITPTAKLTHLFTAYDETSTLSHNLDKKNNHFNVLLPSFGLDMGIFLEKQGTPFGLADKTSNKKSTGRQLLSPRLKYLYTPYKNQANIPNFDTTQASISYEQLLSDNWFLGYDRISDLHAITPALNYRYIDTQGKTRLDAGVAKQFYLNSSKVGLEDDIPTAIRHSELAWQLNTYPSEHLWINLAGTVNQNTPSSLIGMINYTPYANMQFGFGVIERKTNTALRQLPLSAYTASAIYPLSPKWQLLATTQYDANSRKFMDTLVGLNYEDCCIGVSVYGRQQRNALTPTEKPDHTIMAELRLNGLATSQKFARLLKERMIGYTP